VASLVADTNLILMAGTAGRPILFHKATLYIAIAAAASTISIRSSGGSEVVWEGTADVAGPIYIDMGHFPAGVQLPAGESLNLNVSGRASLKLSMAGYGTRL
jgi:hypothetical protein